MGSLFGLLTCVATLLAKILIWAPFSQLMFTFSFGINPCPLSAVRSFPYSSFSSKPEHFVNSLSETRPVQRDETKVTVPLGEIPTSAFQVVFSCSIFKFVCILPKMYHTSFWLQTLKYCN